MFFSKKGKLRNEYNENLLSLMTQAKKEWDQQKSLLDMSADYHAELDTECRINEAKYFFLFREAKKRQISIKRE